MWREYMIEEFLKAKNKITVIETAVVAVLSFVIVYYAPFIMGFMKNYYVNLAVRPLFYIALAAIPFIAGKITKNHLGPLIFKKDDILKQLLAGLYVFFISAAVLTAVSLIIGDYKYFLIGPKQTDIVFIIYNMFFYILCVGMGEEILFRGYFMQRIEELSGSKKMSIVLSSVIFGLWHFPGGQDFIQVFITAILGAFYGVSLYKVKDCSVLSLIVAHGLYNIYIIFLGLLLL
jgi:membrane protease YdiL (CAAX protease family)